MIEEILTNIQNLIQNFISSVTSFLDMINVSLDTVYEVQNWLEQITGQMNSNMSILSYGINLSVALGVTFITVDIIRDLM